MVSWSRNNSHIVKKVLYCGIKAMQVNYILSNFGIFKNLPLAGIGSISAVLTGFRYLQFGKPGEMFRTRADCYRLLL